MALRNNWWLLIWLFLFGGVSLAFIPKREEIVLGKPVQRWGKLSAAALQDVLEFDFPVEGYVSGVDALIVADLGGKVRRHPAGPPVGIRRIQIHARAPGRRHVEHVEPAGYLIADPNGRRVGMEFDGESRRLLREVPYSGAHILLCTVGHTVVSALELVAPPPSAYYVCGIEPLGRTRHRS